jgi:hypothetical protein
MFLERGQLCSNILYMFPPATYITTPTSLKLWAADKYRCSPTLPRENERAEEVAFLLLCVCVFVYIYICIYIYRPKIC